MTGNVAVSTIYIGLQFDVLDVTVPEEFEQVLQKRGINETLTQVVPDYAEDEEQKVRHTTHYYLPFWSLRISSRL